MTNKCFRLFLFIIRATFCIKVILIALCLASLLYVAMGDSDEPRVAVGKPLYFTKVTGPDGSVHYEQHEG